MGLLHVAVLYYVGLIKIKKIKKIKKYVQKVNNLFTRNLN